MNRPYGTGGHMSKKILLVDDDPGVHLLIVPVLSKAGYSAVSAKTGHYLGCEPGYCKNGQEIAHNHEGFYHE